jgi:hypothetical protein
MPEMSPTESKQICTVALEIEVLRQAIPTDVFLKRGASH